MLLFMDQVSGESAPALRDPSSIGEALLALLRNPWRYGVLRWNGKAAILSAMFRGGLFLAVTIKSHQLGRSSGVVAEALFGAVSAGCFGTLTQALRFAEPQWSVELLLAGIFPLLFQMADFYLHAAVGTQVFRIGMVASAVFTVLSSAFNLYVMRRGTLLVGAEGSPFIQDLRTLPRLALRFVVSGVMNPWRFVVNVVSRGIARGTTTSS